MTTPATLETVKAEFDRWRAHKKCSQSRIPKALKQKAQTLLAHYSRDQVAKTLKVPEHRLVSWNLSDSNPIEEKTTSVSTADFVPLPVPVVTPGSSVTLNATLANGASWSLQGEFTPAQLNALVAALMATPGGQP